MGAVTREVDDADTTAASKPELAYAVCCAGMDRIAQQAAAIGKHGAAVRYEDVDGIHDMRVASRRLRVALQEFSPLLPKKPRKALTESARSITRLLGVAREQDVNLIRLADWRETCDASTCAALDYVRFRVQRTRVGESEALREAVDIADSDDFRYQVQECAGGIHPPKKPFEDRITSRLHKRLDQLIEAHSEWQRSRDTEHLHQVRIRFKKLRYTCEAFRGFLGPDIKGVIKALKKAQEALGDWNDQRVLADAIAEGLDKAPPELSGGLDQLSAMVAEKQAALLREFEQDSGHFFTGDTQQRLREIARSPLCR